MRKLSLLLLAFSAALMFVFISTVAFAGWAGTSSSINQDAQTFNFGFWGRFGVSGDFGLQNMEGGGWALGGSAHLNMSQTQSAEYGNMTFGYHGFMLQHGTEWQGQVGYGNANKIGVFGLDLNQIGGGGSLLWNAGNSASSKIAGFTFQDMDGFVLGKGDVGAAQEISRSNSYFQTSWSPNGMAVHYGTLEQYGYQQGSTDCLIGGFDATGGQFAYGSTFTTRSTSWGTNSASGDMTQILRAGGSSDHNATGTLYQGLSTGYYQKSVALGSVIKQNGQITSTTTVNY